MNYNQINEWYNRVCALLEQQRILDALDKIADISSQKGNIGHHAKVEELRFTYGNMLSYTIQGVADPQREQIYNHLLVSVYELADKLKMHLLSKAGTHIEAIRQDLERSMRHSSEDMAESLLSLSFDHELDEMLRSTVLFDDETESETAIQHRKAIIRAFQLLWLTNKLTEDDASRVIKIFGSTSIPWYEKSMMVSALTLGLLRCFDSRKLDIIISLYNTDDARISQRALVGLVIAIGIYDKRILLYPSIMERLLLFRENSRFAEDVESVIIQLIRSKDTEKITRKFRDEIIPDVIRFNEELSEKLNLDKLMSPEEFQDKNPDWEKYFDNQPGFVQKLEELTNMQMEGADVFIGAFAMLKSFPFFNELPNWFMPFYKEHHSVVDALKGEDASFRNILSEGIEKSIFMCNSDKFSFILNATLMPENQKNIMSQMLSAESEQNDELFSEELNDPYLRNKRLIIHYIQDLYRFFRLHPMKNEIGDIFALPMEIHMTTVFGLLIEDTACIREIASFYFDHDHFEEALRVYQHLEKNGEHSAELFEKSGYCLQQKGDYPEAIACYRKADLFDTNRTWLLRKIAQCQLKMNDTHAALETYLELDSVEPESLKTAAAIGTCYLNLNEPEKALEYFYRIEFNDQGSARAMRPVAWCLLLLGRIEEAEPYYAQLLAMEPNAYDFINAGHLAFCKGNKQQAAEYYINSVQQRSGDIRSFLKGFVSDKNILINCGVDKNEIPLMIDYVRFRTSAFN